MISYLKVLPVVSHRSRDKGYIRHQYWSSNHFQTYVHGGRSVLCIDLGKNTWFGLMYLNKALEASLIVVRELRIVEGARRYRTKRIL